MKTKFVDKIVGRLFDRLEKGGLDAALQYGLSVCGGNPQVTKTVVSCAPEPLKTMLGAAIAAKQLKHQMAHEVMVALHAAQDQAKSCTVQVLVSDLKSARKIGQATVFLAGLTMAERGQCGATKQELADAIGMRRHCIRSTRVKQILGCSDTELKRWSEDGRLPVMFRRQMPSSTAAIALQVRHWDLQLVENALQHLLQWREEDALVKLRKRSSYKGQPR